MAGMESLAMDEPPTHARSFLQQHLKRHFHAGELERHRLALQ